MNDKDYIVCPQCKGTNNVSDLGAKWSYEPGPCPLCSGEKVIQCPKCWRAYREGKECSHGA